MLQFSDSLPPQTIPSTLLVDAQGRVAGRFLGAVGPVSSTLRCRTSLPKTRAEPPGERRRTVTGGSLLLAIPLALLAGFVSFASPCVPPLVPGYGVVTGVTGAELTEPVAPDTAAYSPAWACSSRASRLCSSPYGALLGYAGECCWSTRSRYSGSLGVVIIVMGIGFMGAFPWLQREVRWHVSPNLGIWTAPVLGVLFGVGWTPCIGPTLAAVQALVFTEGSALRGALLSLAYCIGLGVPFLVIALAFRRMAGR